MADDPTTRQRAQTEEPVLEPTLVLTFSGKGGAQRASIPREGLLLGREAVTFDAPFTDPRMSPRHAALRCEGGRVLVRDLGSEAGTRLNGKLLIGEQPLEPGDVLRLGDTLCVFASAAPGAAMVAEPELVGSSAAMVAVRRSIDSIASRKHMVVVTGETGTGKEVVAHLIHQRSGRPGPFIAVNCGTFTEGLLSSDLFGHVRGAFTGAVSEQQGLFRAARGGTLLLDEVAEIPLPLQATLLRVLETHEVRPVGGTRDFATDVRVITASNRELIDLVKEGRFRADLYSRLAQWTIRLPPLRERREDIPALINHLLARNEDPGRDLTPDLAEALLLHAWPLNVRGLLTVLSVAEVCARPGDPLDLVPEVRDALWTTRSIESPGDAPASSAGPVMPSKEELVLLMEQFHGKVAMAARHLGVTRPRLYRLLWSNEVKPETFRLP